MSDLINYKTDIKIETLPICMILELPHLAAPMRFIINKKHTQEIANEVSKLLCQTYPLLQQVSMIITGALYDQSQIIRPNFPIFKTLGDITHSGSQGHTFTPKCIAIGSDDHFSVPVLNPEKKQRGPLAILPILLLGEQSDIENLTYDLEETLMQDVKITAEIKQKLTHYFDCNIINLGFATLADTVGMLASQLIQIGLEPIWHILKSVLFNIPNAYLAALDTGHRLLWDNIEECVRIFECTNNCYIQTDQAKSQSFEQYQEINMRFKLLLTSHGIPFMPCVINHPTFLNQKPTLEDALHLIKQQIKQL